jgi:hypothetical protein
MKVSTAGPDHTREGRFALAGDSESDAGLLAVQAVRVVSMPFAQAAQAVTKESRLATLGSVLDSALGALLEVGKLSGLHNPVRRLPEQEVADSGQ